MPRQKAKIPPLCRLEQGLWYREPWFSVARAGRWMLRVHHKRCGWRAHVRCGPWRLLELDAPAATRAEAEQAIREAAARRYAETKESLQALASQPAATSIPDPPEGDPTWRTREPGRWYRYEGIPGDPGPRGVSGSVARAGVLGLYVLRHLERSWWVDVLCGMEPIHHFPARWWRDPPILARAEGEAAALRGAFLRLAEIGAALARLQAPAEGVSLRSLPAPSDGRGMDTRA